jgi:Tfp pilus assembly protein PilF
MRSRLLTLSLVLAFVTAACSDPETTKMRHLQKADEHMAKEEYAEAVLEYRNALKVDARFGEARYKLAEAYLKTERPSEAAREFVRAADLLPDRADVQLKAGTILLAAREFERARSRAEGGSEERRRPAARGARAGGPEGHAGRRPRDRRGDSARA